MQRNKENPDLNLKKTNQLTNPHRTELDVNYYEEFIVCFYDGILMLIITINVKSMKHLLQQLEFPCNELCEIFLLVPLA